MSFQCLNPHLAVKLFDKPDGKQFIQFLPKRIIYNLDDLRKTYGSENVYTLPCGECESCRRNYSEQWAVRCVLEAKYHKFNYFITLTYNDSCLDKASFNDFKRFKDRLAGKHHSNKFKYFGCFERGELTNRLHLHLVLFCDFPLTLKDQTKLDGYYYYHSPEIQNAWSFGLHNVAPFETNCARYVAKYTNKNGSKCFMSRNLGLQYVLDNYNKIIEDDFIIYGDFNTQKYTNLPTCFLRYFIKNNVSKASIRRDFLKNLAHLVSCDKKRKLVAEYSDQVIHSDINRLKEKKVKRRIL